MIGCCASVKSGGEGALMRHSAWRADECLLRGANESAKEKT
jgi:hypothetical protein